VDEVIGTHRLFGAILGESAETELATVMAEIRGTDDPAAVIDRVAQMVTRRIVDDTDQGQLGLEFAARAARDEQTRAVLGPIRRAQRAAAARSIAEVVERTGTRPAIGLDLAALILHCLTNGLTNERIADPEAISAEVIEQAFSAALAALLSLPQTTEGTA
jgi:hypothetical protein